MSQSSLGSSCSMTRWRLWWRLMLMGMRRHRAASCRLGGGSGRGLGPAGLLEHGILLLAVEEGVEPILDVHGRALLHDQDEALEQQVVAEALDAQQLLALGGRGHEDEAGEEQSVQGGGE